MKKKALAIALLFAFALIKPVSGFAANGDYVYTSISYAQSSAVSNAIWNVVNPLEMDGTNNSQSTKPLYVECRNQVNYAADPIVRELKVPAGAVRTTGRFYPSLVGGTAYVKLDPEGLGGGCTGKGELWD